MRTTRTTRTKAHVYEEIRYVTVTVTDGFLTAVHTERLPEEVASRPKQAARAARKARQQAHAMLTVLQEVEADV